MNVKRGPGFETECIDDLLWLRPECQPNPIIVALADELLGRHGTIIAAHNKNFDACPEPGILE